MRNWILDLDGVVYRGDNLIPSAREFLLRVRERGDEVVFFTNNSLYTPEQYVRKLQNMGITSSLKDIYTSGELAAEYVQEKKIRKVFAIGEKGLKMALRKRNIKIVEEKEEIEGVVVGLDRRFTYHKLSLAHTAILKGALFIATNTDSTLPVEEGILPGAGSIIAAIKESTGKEPLVIGKPHTQGLEIILKERKWKKEDTTIIGDRWETDILLGKNSGIRTVLVLTGVTQEKNLSSFPHSRLPDQVVKSLPELLHD